MCREFEGGDYFISATPDKHEILDGFLELGDSMRDRRIAEFLESMNVRCLRDLVKLRYMLLAKTGALETGATNHIGVLLAYHGLKLGMDEKDIDAWLRE